MPTFTKVKNLTATVGPDDASVTAFVQRDPDGTKKWKLAVSVALDGGEGFQDTRGLAELMPLPADRTEFKRLIALARDNALATAGWVAS